jgi:hypothetical protein
LKVFRTTKEEKKKKEKPLHRHRAGRIRITSSGPPTPQIIPIRMGVTARGSKPAEFNSSKVSPSTMQIPTSTTITAAQLYTLFSFAITGTSLYAERTLIKAAFCGSGAGGNPIDTLSDAAG